MAPDQVIIADDNTTQYRYRSYRATDGFWETKFDPSGYLPGAWGTDPTGPICGVPPLQCFTDKLNYVKSIQRTTREALCVVSGAGEVPFDSDIDISITNYFIAPGAATLPPSDGIPRSNMPYFGTYSGVFPAGCPYGFMTQAVDSQPTGLFDFPGTFSTVYFLFVRNQLEVYLIDSMIVSFPGSNGSVPDGGLSCVFQQRTGVIADTYYFENQTPVVHHSYCIPGTPGEPPTDPIDRPLRYTCNCPDAIQSVEALPWSQYRSELIDRTIIGNTHTLANGPCKHIYSAAIAAREPFRDPATVSDPWTLQDAPRRIVVSEFDPVPPNTANDNNYEELRRWRQERRQRRIAFYRQRRENYAQRRELAERNRTERYERMYQSGRTNFYNDADANLYSRWRLRVHPPPVYE
jgi:hypothetical protein